MNEVIEKEMHTQKRHSLKKLSSVVAHSNLDVSYILPYNLFIGLKNAKEISGKWGFSSNGKDLKNQSKGIDMLEHLQDFLNYLVFERGLSKNTLESYRRSIKKLISFLKNENIDNFSLMTQGQFVQFLKTFYEKGLQANTIRSTIEACKSFFRFMKREDIIKTNPISEIESPKIWEKIPDIINPQEMIKLVEIPDLKTESGVRNRAILEVLYGSGLRVSELCDLKFKDFNLNEKTLIVIGKGNKQRIVPFSKSCLSAISEYWLHYRPGIKNEDYAFVTNPKSNRKLNRISVWRSVKSYAKECGFNHKNIHPHTFRHCFATHLMDNGADIRVIQDLLGHSDITTTGLYMHLSLNQLKEKFYKHHPRQEITNPRQEITDENLKLRMQFIKYHPRNEIIVPFEQFKAG